MAEQHSTLKCPQCGAHPSPGSRYCGSCGHDFGNEAGAVIAPSHFGRLFIVIGLAIIVPVIAIVATGMILMKREFSDLKERVQPHIIAANRTAIGEPDATLRADLGDPPEDEQDTQCSDDPSKTDKTCNTWTYTYEDLPAGKHEFKAVFREGHLISGLEMISFGPSEGYADSGVSLLTPGRPKGSSTIDGNTFYYVVTTTPEKKELWKYYDVNGVVEPQELAVSNTVQEEPESKP